MIAVGMTEPQAGERVLDLYSGVGLFAAFLAEAVGPDGSVVAVEGDRIATANARDNLAELNDAGVDVLGISPDSPAKLARFRDAEGLTFPLLSDQDKTVLAAWGAFGEKQMYGKTVTGVIRSTFLVDPEGKIEEALYNVRASGHVAKLRKDLKV